MAFAPSAEQRAIIDAARNKRSLIVQAGAGCGKTATLQLAAQAIGSGTRCRYAAYNRAAALDAKKKMPAHVVVQTVHSLAYRATVGSGDDVAAGARCVDRLDLGNATGRMIVERLSLRGLHLAARTVGPTTIGYLAMGAVRRFCYSARTALAPRDVGLRDWAAVLDADEMEALRGAAFDAAQRLWGRYTDIRGSEPLPVPHDLYLKLYVEGVVAGRLPMPTERVLMVDEFQDSNAITLKLVRACAAAGTQVIAVGDPYQQIYSFRGSQNALDGLSLPVFPLMGSYRFGHAIAGAANAVVASYLGEDPGLRGLGGPSVIGELEATEPGVTGIYRTNAGVLGGLFAALEAGRTPRVANGEPLAREIESVERLRDGQRPTLPEYMVFRDYAELLEHAESDDGARIKMLLNLIGKYGAAQIMDAARTAGARRAGQFDWEGVTAHGSKGLQYRHAYLGDDFPEPKEGALADEEARLLYVAITRGEDVMDISRAPAAVEAMERAPLAGSRPVKEAMF